MKTKDQSKKATKDKKTSKRHEVEIERPQSAGDGSYSESVDVTPPNAHEVPSVGIAETDFVSPGKHGRSTSRMLDHEPGL